MTATTERAEPRSAEARVRVDVSSLLELSGPEARTILFIFIGAQGVLAFALPDATAVPWRTAVAFAGVVVAAFWVTRPAPDPYPREWAWGVVGLSVAVTVLQSFQLSPTDRPLFAAWHVGAVTVVFMVLSLRARAREAWIGFALIVIVTLVWSITSGAGILEGIELVVRHAGSLVVASLIAIGLRSLAASMTRIAVRLVDREEAEATQAERMRERAEQLDRLDRLAGGLLTKVAAAEPLTDDERQECLLVEAALRDQVRGRGLATPEIAAVARSARRRGVVVTLLDDSDGETDTTATLSLLAAELLSLDAGSVTARLLPAGRLAVASVAIERDGVEDVYAVMRDGTVN